MRKNSLFKRLMSVVICLALVLAYVPASLLSAAADDQVLNILNGSKKADPSTMDNWKQYFGPNKLDTEFAGGVWTDKSVFAGVTDQLPGVALNGGNNFLVALSAIASNVAITGHTSAPTDTMLVLDLSGSMVDGTYEVGTVRNGNRYETVNGIDMSLVTAMVEATNATIDKLMKQNTNNRVGVVLYSGNAESDQAATPDTATVVLPLGRYAGINGEYLSLDTTWQTAALYKYVRNGWFGNWQATGETATYVATGTNVSVSVKDGLKTEAGANVRDGSKRANGGTYLQNGLYQAMSQFLAVTDIVVPEGRPQAGAERLPVIVLMSDGAPTIATTSYNSIGNSNVGDGTSTSDRITFLTQLTAAYVRGRVAAKYQQNENDEKEVLFLTLGLGTENSSAATNTLYPAGSSDTLKNYWSNYLAGTAGQNVQITSGNNGWSVYRDAAVSAMNYVDKYFYASNAEGLIESFEEIVSEIALKAESYATLVEGGNADFSGYVTFEDALGEMMYVADMKGILMDDGNGGKVLYTGKGIAESMSNGNLGTVDNPTERGNELVSTVKERIPGITTTQAQQLIANAYADQQLYYLNDNNWSNYIGWYADADGNYIGFWDKDSSLDNVPANAVRINKSYGYLGINGDSDMMHVVVMVSTDLKTQNQTVTFKIPASLMPTVQYRVTLKDDQADEVETFERKGAVPMTLVFETGLRPDINSINLEKKITEHAQKGGHFHRNNDGTVSFYTNEWAIGNDKNGNGIPDPEEVDTAVVTQSHFHPALDNSRYYYTEDTVILTDNDTVVTGARPTDTDNDAANGTGYYYNRYIYSANGRKAIKTPIAAVTLANDAVQDSATGSWYIPEGTMYHNLARFEVDKTKNETGTLYYSWYPAVFDSVSKQDFYTFLGNNGIFTVEPAQGIALTKTVGEVSEDPNAPTSFTFTVKLSQAVPNPVITDTDGNLLSGVASVSGDTITVTLKAGQTVVISGIPTGTTYTVEEVQTEYYTAVSANATGTVMAYTVNAVDFVNNAKGYGSLVVGKDVNYPDGFVPGAAHNNTVFPITVTFVGDITGITVPQGATQDGNAFHLNLKDAQSVTFANIPEGVTYTVAEGQTPNGYSFQELRYSDTNKTIDGKDIDQVNVINRYSLAPVSANVTIQGEKDLITNESTWGGETFTVELFELDHLADEEPRSTGLTATMTEADPSYKIDLSTIPFTKAGVYYFRAVEVIPANRNENIAYDRTVGMFSVTVGDDNADGNLEVQRVDAYQSTTVTGNSQSGWILTKNFTNVVSTDRVYINIQKNIVDSVTGQPVNVHRGDIAFGLFPIMSDTAAPAYYALTNTQGVAEIMIPVSREDIQKAQNQRLVYFLREAAPADANRVVGMHYNDSWIYEIEITWDDVTNQAVVRYTTIENDQIQQNNWGPYVEGTTVLEHTNTYEQNVSVELDLSGKKTLNGKDDLGGREFSFSLYKSTAAFVKGDLITTVKNSGNAIAFQDISFTAPGAYHMVAKEEASNLGGITVDATEYHITVIVEKFVDTDGVTRLRVVDTTVLRYGTSEDVGIAGLHFNNRYTVTGSGDVTIGGKKVLNGRALVAGEFAIGLYRDAACTDLIESAFNKADGTFSFSAITYTAANLGADYADATYTYYVKEIPNGKGGVTYDPTVHTVTVKVSHKDGALIVTPSDNAATLQITNTYEAKPVDVTLNGSKKLSGDWTAVANKDFTFQLFAADANFAITDQTPVKTATVTGAADFSMKLSYMDGDEGYYYYVLKEYIPAEKAGGVGYDAGEYHITVNVSDPGNGQLVAQTTIYRPGTGNTTDVTFTNSYTVEPTTITLEGTKTYTNSVTSDPMAMEEGIFSFAVLEGQDLAATGYNLTDGTIQFTPIRYTAAGVHTYTVVEIAGNAGGVTYDTQTRFTVTVTVTDNGNGTLTAAVNYNGVPVKFQNTYTHQAAQVTLNGEKQLTGDWSKVPEANKLFTFVLYKSDSSFAVSGTPVDIVSAKAGDFTFGTLTYTVPGTYYYVVLEKAGDPDNGITYSTAKYQITVDVKDDGQGNLIPTVTAAGATVTVDPANSRLVTVDDLKFTNEYKVKPAQYTPEAKKSYKGKEMKKFDFVLTVDGNDKQTKQNDEQGNVAFDMLTFDAPGEYVLKIREQKNALWGLIRWDTNVYTVKLTVEDNGLGQLVVNESKTVITSQKGSTDLVFRNADHDEITKKEVFLEAAPTVNIDGKAVEKNDILTYKISYTNYDIVPVDVEIVDTVPQYTTYVAGSADHNGVITGSTLRWQLTAVEPGATVTVTFKVKVVDTTGTVTNSATVLEGENQYQTNAVKTPIKEDTFEKDAALAKAPTISIDGKPVEKGDVLVYKLTYTNSDDFTADVTITDTIPAHTAYVAGSADNGGVYAEGVLTWKLQLAAGETKTVTFKVKVVDTKATVTNKATAQEGENKLETNQVRTPVEEDLVTKDVFQVSAPTVSIDGKKVEKGDVLLYKITYTNLYGQAADVTITDTVPQYTQYVDGSADNGGVLADGVLTWKLQLAAGESKTVSFQVKVIGAEGEVSNQATALEGENKLETNAVKTPIEEDIFQKDSFLAAAPTVSIGGKTVNEGDVLVYKLTYTNTDDFAADVTITDTIPQYTTYVAGSADNGGVYAEGVLTWKLQLAAGETKTVSFQVKVNDLDGAGASITNKATAVEGENTVESNQVPNFVPETFDNPVTGDGMNIGLMAMLMISSIAGLFVLLIARKKVTE